MDHSREVRELAQLLRSPEVQRSPEKYLEGIKRVVNFMTQGIDVSALFSDLVKATNTRNLVQKKLVYLFLCHYADTNPQLAMMVVNTLQKDARDENPMVRGLALRSLTSLRIVSLIEYVVPVVMQSLGDHTAYVRRTAVMGILKMYYLDRERVLEGDTIDRLYALLRDRDPIVVVNAVTALEEILADRGGMMLNRAIAHHLLTRLRDFNDWGQCTVMQLVSRYVPEDEEEIYTLLNFLDDRMKHVNPGVVLAAAKLFISLSKDLPHLHEDIYDAIRSSLLTLLSANGPEISYVVMQHLQLLVARSPDLLEADYRHFFIGYSDPIALKKQKIHLLVDIATSRNCSPIVDELSEYATDSHVVIGRLAIRSMGLIAMKVHHGADYVVDKLLALSDLNMDVVSAEVLVAFRDILRTYPHRGQQIVTQIEPTLRVVDDPDAKVALLWILGEYGEFVEESPYILEEIIEALAAERSPNVRLALLTASARLFFKRPAEMQYMFGTLLKSEISSESPLTEPHDRALLYYRILTAPGGGIEAAKKIINWPHPLTERIGSALSEQLLDTLLFKEFNSLSVSYGRPSELFVSQQPPYARVAFGGYDGEDHVDAHFDASPAPSGSLSLRSSVSMDMQSFQGLWKSSTEVSQFQVTLAAVEAEKKALEAYLTSLSVFTMASGGTGGALKMLCYGQDAASAVVLLVEVKIGAGSDVAAVTVKGGMRANESAPQATVAAVVRQFSALLESSL